LEEVRSLLSSEYSPSEIETRQPGSTSELDVKFDYLAARRIELKCATKTGLLGETRQLRSGDCCQCPSLECTKNTSDSVDNPHNARQVRATKKLVAYPVHLLRCVEVRKKHQNPELRDPGGRQAGTESWSSQLTNLVPIPVRWTNTNHTNTKRIFTTWLGPDDTTDFNYNTWVSCLRSFSNRPETLWREGIPSQNTVRCFTWA
jgi:hypothetical protein